MYGVGLVRRWCPAAVLQYFCSILMLLHQGSSKPAGTVRYRRRANVIHSVLRVVRMRGIVVVDREESYGVFRIHLPLSYKLNSPKVEVEVVTVTDQARSASAWSRSDLVVVEVSSTYGV